MENCGGIMVWDMVEIGVQGEGGGRVQVFHRLVIQGVVVVHNPKFGKSASVAGCFGGKRYMRRGLLLLENPALMSETERWDCLA